MNIKKYEAFVRAVELGSLSKAAEELGYTQSGISHMMQSLEEEVGFPLMTRTSSGIMPNTEGEMLLPTIRSRCEILSLVPPPGDALCGDEADKLARLLLSGTEREVLEYGISLEKLDRERFTALLDETAAALVKYSRENPAQLPRILHAVDLLKKLRSAASFYVGNGHLYGWLCAALFSDS
mgnify:CR=1 FL=1